MLASVAKYQVHSIFYTYLIIILHTYLKQLVINYYTFQTVKKVNAVSLFLKQIKNGACCEESYLNLYWIFKNGIIENCSNGKNYFFMLLL